MRSFGALLSVLLVCASAQAVPLCEADHDHADDMSFSDSSADAPGLDVRGPDALAHEHELAVPKEAPVEILPCSVVDSGALGPTCLEASGYLVTQGGQVLCQVAVPDDPTAFSEPVEVSERGAPAGSFSPDFQAVSAQLCPLLGGPAAPLARAVVAVFAPAPVLRSRTANPPDCPS